MVSYFADIRSIAAIIIAWTLIIIIVNPVGDFPLVDEWAYVVPVQSLLRGEGLTFSAFTAPNLLSQVIWGWGFASVFGFSYNVMRYSILTVAAIGLVAFYGLLRSIHITPNIALFATYVLMANPIFVALSFTFMSDIFFLSFMLLSICCLAWSFRQPRPALTAAGWVFGLIAQLCRQLGAAIAIGNAVAVLSSARLRWKTVFTALVPIVLFMFLQILYEEWLERSGRTPLMLGYNAELIRERLAQPVSMILHEVGNALVYLLFYLGLMTVPVSVFLFRTELVEFGGRAQRQVWIAAATLIVVSIVMIAVLNGGMPFWGHVITDWGVGGEMGEPSGRRTHIRVFLTLLAGLGGTLGGLILFYRVWQHLRSERQGHQAAVRSLCFVTAMVIWAPVPFMVLRFDRYLLPVAACLTVVVLARVRWAARLPSMTSAEGVVALCITTLIGAYSIVATRDYLATGRAREAALAIAVAQGVPRDQIDAGWVLNGRDLHPSVGNPMLVHSWHNDPVVKLDYRLHRGYAKIAEVEIGRWMPVADSPLIVQRRIDDGVNYIGPRSRAEIKEHASP